MTRSLFLVAFVLADIALASVARADEPARAALVPMVTPAEPSSPSSTSLLELASRPDALERVLPDGAAPPPGSSPLRRTRPGVVGGGIALFTATYALSVTAVPACALVGCRATAGDKPLLIPLLGPFVQMSRTQNIGGNVLLGLDGLAQLGGAAMITMGLAFKQDVFVSAERVARVTFAPAIDRAGFVLDGVF